MFFVVVNFEIKWFGRAQPLAAKIKTRRRLVYVALPFMCKSYLCDLFGNDSSEPKL